MRDRNAGPLADDLGDVFLVHLFLQHARGAVAGVAAVLLRVQLAQLGFQPWAARRTGSAAARSRWPLRVCSSASKRSASICSFSSLMRRDGARAPSVQRARSAGGLLLDLGELALDCLAAARCEFGSVSRFSAARSISSEVASRSSSSISVGTEPIWMASEAAASSTRSMALSGRKRSEM